jgi:hypothetical protein
VQQCSSGALLFSLKLNIPGEWPGDGGNDKKKKKMEFVRLCERAYVCMYVCIYIHIVLIYQKNNNSNKNNKYKCTVRKNITNGEKER